MIDRTIQRAQVYGFLAHAFLYPQENWLEELPDLQKVLEKMHLQAAWESGDEPLQLDLAALQSQHRDTLGLTGSLCYETEFGLPHEFRQSQELADIAGFYQAFGFRAGGTVRERPDHLATELEFMYILALKEAYAYENEMQEQAEICLDAQRKFLEDHLGRWLHLFYESLRLSTEQRLGAKTFGAPYLRLAQLADGFIAEDARRMGVDLEASRPVDLKPTPYNADTACAGCAVADPVQ